MSYVNQENMSTWTKEMVISGWAVNDPAAAADFVNELEDGGSVNNWVTGLVRGLARVDPESAWATLEALPREGKTWEYALREILPQVSRRGTEYASTWIEGVSDPEVKKNVVNHLASDLTRRQPREASQWVASMEDVTMRRNASEQVTARWARMDLEAARDWVESLPQNTMTEAAEGVARRLGEVDPQDGAAWLARLGDDPDLDGARLQYLREASRRDPVTAIEVVGTVSNEEWRSRQYREVLSQWSRRDRDGMVNWLQENPQVPSSVANRYLPKNLRRN